MLAGRHSLSSCVAALCTLLALLALSASPTQAQLTPYQRLTTYLDVGTVAAFSIDNVPFLAVPDTQYLDPTNDDIIINIICDNYINCNIPSKLYRWDSSTQQFEFFQNLDGCALTLGFTYFVEGGVNYLLCESILPKAFLYSWDPSTESQFESYENITLLSFPLSLEMSFDLLQIGSDTFFVATMPLDLKENTGFIEILHWNATTKQIQPFQTINPATPPVTATTIVTSEGVGLIAYPMDDANEDDLITNMNTKIAFFNTTSRQFEDIQTLVAFLALDAQLFAVGSETFLVMNEGATPWPPVPQDDDSYPPITIEVGFYRWSPSSFSFDHIQSIFTVDNFYIGCTAVDISSNTYVVCTSTKTTNDYNFAYSDAYIWEPASQQFVLLENLVTPAFAEKFSSFAIDGQTYLATSFIGGNDYNFTEVYQWNPINSTTVETTTTKTTKTTHKHTTTKTTTTPHKKTTTPVPSANWILSESSCTNACANLSQACNLASLQAVNLENILAVSQSLSITCTSATPGTAASAPGFLFTTDACQFPSAAAPTTCEALPPADFLRYCCCNSKGCPL